MNVLKHYQVQILLLILAGFEIFAYFYPGYAKGFLFAILQVCLVILVIARLLANRTEFMKHHYH